MTTLKDCLSLFRIQQWYKNIVVFLALFFSGNLFTINVYQNLLFSFISLSFLSSAGYILNDLKDLTEDKLHPEKMHRPLAAGKISKLVAITLGVLILFIGFMLAYTISSSYFLISIVFFLLAATYTLCLKKIIFADVLTISVVFVLRAIAGALAINVWISPWLILVPFFLALFLATGKRHSELLLLKEKATATRKVLEHYTLQLTTSMMTIATALLIISYALYSFLSEHPYLLITIPFALFLILRFYYLISIGSPISRSPEKIINDKEMVIGVLLWLIITTIIIYQ